jgi:RimJ/RimL family protein N-acetyltransferase
MRHMLNPATFSVRAPLRHGGQVEIRALRPSDRNALLLAAARASDRSLYRRFFGVRREFSDAEVAGFIEVDFKNQVALVAVSDESGHEVIVAGARYIIVRPGMAEVAFMVVDAFQGRGIASTMLRHLAELARAAGLTAFVAEVMPDNSAMLRVLERSGLPLRRERDSDVVHVTLELG